MKNSANCLNWNQWVWWLGKIDDLDGLDMLNMILAGWYYDGGRGSELEGMPEEDTVGGVKEDMRSFCLSHEDAQVQKWRKEIKEATG